MYPLDVRQNGFAGEQEKGMWGRLADGVWNL